MTGNRYKYLDLRRNYNARMVYLEQEAKDDKSLGEESGSYFFDNKNFVYGYRKLSGEPVFYLMRRKDKKDCVRCQGQEISLEDEPCEGLMFAGFCTWGYFKEEV